MIFDIAARDNRTHPIAEEEHGTCQPFNLGHGYHSIIWLFARADDLTVTLELPEPMRIVDLAQARDCLPVVRNIRGDLKTIFLRNDVELRLLSETLRSGARTRRARVWEFDLNVRRDGLFIVTMG